MQLNHRVLTDRLFARIKSQAVDPQIDGLRARLDALAAEQRSHTDNRAGAVEMRLDRIEAELRDAWERLERLERGVADHLPFLLDRLSATNAMSREARRRLQHVEDTVRGVDGRLDAQARHISGIGEGLNRVEARTEFVRREFMHELRYGRREGAVGEIETRILNENGLAVSDGMILGAADGALRLNLGAGHVAREGYVNVDARPLDGIDVVADVHALPVAPGCVEEIYAAHLAEHFPEEDLRRGILPHWLALLRPGGILRLIVPDAEAMLSEHAAGRYSFDDLRLVTFGEQEYEGDFHFNMFSREGLRAVLAGVGFEDVRLVADTRRNGASYEMELRATKPRDEDAPQEASAGDSTEAEALP